MPIRTTTSAPGINWHGSFFVHHSLALVNRELTLALLDRGGLDIGIQEYEAAQFAPDADPRFSRLAVRSRANLATPLVTVRHLWPPDFSRPSTPRFVLIQPWEFGSLPVSWVEGISRTVDECWVPSSYVKQVYEESGVPGNKVFVVPNGVNTTRFHPGVEPYALPTTKGFKFLFVGGTIGRKGIDLLLDAYTRAFTSADDVSLIIKDFGQATFYEGQGAGALISAIQAKPGAPEIVHLTKDLSESDIAGLYASCDALAHPYRGEGYGLPIAEAMACGKPVVITGAGAAMDFADDETAYLVPAKEVHLSQRRVGDWPTVDLPWWYEPDVEALAATLRHVYEKRDEAAARGAAAAQRIAINHTWAAAAAVAGDRLLALAQSATAPRSAARPVAIEPIAYENRKQKALALTREGKWAEAIEEAEACLRAHASDDDLLNALAVARYRSGDRTGAIALLREQLSRSPGSSDFRHNLAFMLLANGEGVDALVHALDAARLRPDSPEIRQTLDRARSAAKKEGRRIRKTSGRSDTRFLDIQRLMDEADSILSRQVAHPAAAEPEFKPARISAVMIVRNEEKFLEDCLRSIQGAVDEIVLVDTGSTDRTVEIAMRYGAKVVRHEWNDDFSEARNVSLEHATGDWALWLDADERLAEGEGDLLKYLVNAAESNVGGYMVNIKNFMTRAEHPEVCWHRACRLFRLDSRIRFNGRIHEQNMRGIQDAGFVCALSQLTLDHYGYAAEVMNERGKHERFIRMLTREVEENPDNAYRTFHLFNLGNAYFTRGDMQSAALWLARAAEGADPAEEYTSLLFVEWATALYASGRAKEALDACAKAEQTGVDHPAIDFARGHAYLHLKEYVSAEQAFRAAIERGRTGTFVHTGDAGAYTYKAHYGLALALTGQDRHEDSIEECRLAIGESPRFADARYLLANGLRRAGMLPESRAAFEELLAMAPSHLLAVADYACTLHSIGDLPASLTALRRASMVQPGSLEIWSRLGDTALSLGFADEAREAYINARRIAPASPEVLVNLGRTYSSLGMPDRALDCFTDAIHAAPGYANAYFNAGDLLYRLEFYPQAAETLAAGLEVEPENGPGFLVLGNCLAKMGELGAAREAFARAIVVRPDYAEAAQNLQTIEEMLTAQAA